MKNNKNKIKHKWGIVIYSKYTGESITLGSQYDSYDDAVKGAELQVCERCNRIEIMPIPLNSLWVNKKEGFKQIKNENPNLP